jgi:hypothetical protein
MITINITIEAELNAKLDETGMYLQEKDQDKLDSLLVKLEKQVVTAGFDSVVVECDFYDDEEEEDTDMLSEGITVMEVGKTEGWNTEDIKREGEVEEEGRKYKKT